MKGFKKCLLALLAFGMMSAFAAGENAVTALAGTSATEETETLVKRGKRTTLTAEAGEERVTLTWDPVEDVYAYRIYRSETKTGGYKKLKSVKAAKTTVTIRVGSEETYFYKVVPLYYDENGKKKRDKASMPVEATSIEAAPEIVAFDFSDETATIAWTYLHTFDGYLVLKSEQVDSGYKRYAYVDDLEVTTYTDNAVAMDGTYYYKVCGYQTVGKKKVFGPKSDPIKVAEAEPEEQEDVMGADGGEEMAPAEEDAQGSDTGENPSGTQKTLPQIIAESEKTDLISYASRYNARFGIDISKWQGSVDFEKVKNAGVSFVMLRAASGTDKDTKFESYFAEIEEKGFDKGVYVYSKAMSVEEAVKEAENVLTILDGRTLTLPIAYDMEDSSQLKLTNAERTDIALAFKETVEAAGYSYILYANKYWLTTLFENVRLVGSDIWIARYTDYESGHGYDGNGTVKMWQFSSKGVIDGITENYVDLDVIYDLATGDGALYGDN